VKEKEKDSQREQKNSSEAVYGQEKNEKEKSKTDD